MEAAIKIENLHKSFGKEEILHGINREFEAGKIHGIVGNNGSGKTGMMKCILRTILGRHHIYSGTFLNTAA